VAVVVGVVFGVLVISVVVDVYVFLPGYEYSFGHFFILIKYKSISRIKIKSEGV
jgi:hypothetical protein